jgi:hypothetical protein
MRTISEIIATVQENIRSNVMQRLYEKAPGTKIKPKKEASPGNSADTKGKLHELLVGYHMQGGKHMSKHPDEKGDTPKQAHDKLKEKVSPAEYKHIHQRAKAAAEHIRSQVESKGHTLSHVHWTSKAGDIESSTGIKASQKEDASDIVVHTKDKKGKIKHHGVSLKVTDSKNKHVPVSNPGMESTHGGEVIHKQHRDEIRKKFPALAKATNAKSRKEIMKANPKMDAWVRNKNKETLNKLGHHLHKVLSNMKPHELSHHIKTHVLQANETPLQKAGHTHIRHTTYVGKDGKHAFHAYDPSKHFEHIFKDPKNITHHVKVEHTGGASVHFKYKGKTFASHRLKFNSQSDPLSSVKGSGIAGGEHG